MTRQNNWLVAVVGSGDIGADLMAKIRNSDGPLTVAARAHNDIRIILDTAADAERDNLIELAHAGVRVIDLTPAATGPWCVPAVNLDDLPDADYLNMATWDAQAAVPIVAAVAQSGIVSYAEIVSSISSAAVGPDARVAIDSLTQITAAAVQVVGGAECGKAMMILNPAAPPMMMRNTVYCLVAGDVDHQRIESNVLAMVDKVRTYIPGYRLKQRIQFETFSMSNPLYIPETGKFTGTRVTVLLEVTGAGDYAPAYAGNVDLMTAAAKATTERIAARAAETAGLPT
jgi:acetaldehyde dehydrogenase